MIAQKLFLLELLSIIVNASDAVLTPLQSSSLSPRSSIFSSIAFYKNGNQVIVYGGTNSRISSVYSSLYSFDITNQNWSELVPKSSIFPPELYSSIAFIYGQKYYLLFGITENRLFPDCYSFDLQSREWNLEVLNGIKIEPALESASILFEYEGDSYLAIHGGVTSKGKSADLYL